MCGRFILSDGLAMYFHHFENGFNQCGRNINSKRKPIVNVRNYQASKSTVIYILKITQEAQRKMAGVKLNALTRIPNHMPFQKRKWLMNAFFKSQFSYCTLNWMFHSRKLNNKISRLHKRYLHVVYFNCKFILSILFLSTINK